MTSSSVWQGQFRSRMLNEGNYERNFHNTICPIVSQEAAALGKSAAVATDFCHAMTWLGTSGNYQYT